MSKFWVFEESNTHQMYILSLMVFTEYWFFSFTVTVCNTSTPHQSEVLFLRCACRKLLWLLLKLLRCIVYFCISAESVCLCVLLLCRWVKQETELSKNAQLGDSGPKLDLGFKEGQTITLNIGVRTSLCAYTIHADKNLFIKEAHAGLCCWRMGWRQITQMSLKGRMTQWVMKMVGPVMTTELSLTVMQRTEEQPEHPGVQADKWIQIFLIKLTFKSHLKKQNKPEIPHENENPD